MIGNNHIEFNKKSLENWILPLLLPGQSIDLLATEHYVTEHPQVSVAFATSERSYMTSDKIRTLEFPQLVPYLDSKKFINELSSIGDRLYTQLLNTIGDYPTMISLNSVLSKSGGEKNRLGPIQIAKSFKPDLSSFLEGLICA